MGKRKLIDSIPDDLRIVADAMSGHHRVSNRIWLISATVTLIIIGTGSSGNEEIRLFGLHFESDRFYPISVILLSFTNIAYCSAYMQALRSLEILQSRLESVGGQDIYYTEKHSLSDVVHSLYMPSLKRIYPLTRILPLKWHYPVFYLFRVFSDAVFYGLPIVGAILGIYKSQLGFALIILLSVIVLISIGAAAILQRESLDKLKQDRERIHKLFDQG